MTSHNDPSQETFDFDLEPIRGYPELRWAGKKPFTSTHYYPAQLKETYGQEVDGWRNKIFWGDNLQAMSHLLRDYRGKIKLIYIDPPFDSKADYKRKIKTRKGDTTTDATSFEEKQYTDVWGNDEFLQFIYERIVLLRDLLSENGIIFLHCDSSKGHHIRCLMDEVFGPSNFLNEIIWSYRRWPSNSKAFQSMHDNIFSYVKRKSSTYSFHVQYEEASESYMKRFGGKTQILDTETGTRKITSEEETKGMPLRDVWDISILAGFKKERTGYPTQKPEELLNRIIEVCSDENDIVLDCFMGSGTTLASSIKTNRRFIGIDINLSAVHIATKRLVSVIEENRIYAAGLEVYNVNDYDLFRNPVEAKELLIDCLSINKIIHRVYDGEKDGRMVKIMPINRIASRSDLRELITNMDYQAFEQRRQENPSQAVEKLLLVCMGHEPDLKAHLEKEVPYLLDVEIVDILRDRKDIRFKRESQARVEVEGDHLVIKQFYPMNLLQKLSWTREEVSDWRELTDSVLVDFNYDGAVFQPTLLDVPEGDEWVKGRYRIPDDAGTIRVKITDLISESLEVEVQHG